MESRWGRRLGLALGCIYLAFAAAEITVRIIDYPGIGPLLFWGLTLLTAGILVLVGTQRRTIARARTPMIAIGVAIGTLPTLWTLLIPALGVAVIVLSAREESAAGPPPAPGQETRP